MVVGDPAAELVTVTVPAFDPAAVGLKTTLKVNVWPEASVTGTPAPLSVNPAPFSAIPETVTLALPELVTVTPNVDELPVFTFPNPRLVVLNDSDCEAATPVPVSAINAGELGALLTTVMLPLVAPAAVGANCTVRFAELPAAIFNGRASVPTLKPAPVALTWETVRVPVPLFSNWIVWVLGLLPTVKLPKLALAGVIVKPACNPVPDTGMTALAPCVLDTVMLPLMFSAALGLNVTLRDVLCPAARVTGVLIPLTAKSFAFTLTPETLRLVLPLFVMVTLFELEVPAFTPVKLRLDGVDDRVTEAAVPEPLNARTLGEFGALLEMLTVPV
jgi:hypothetical protein